MESTKRGRFRSAFWRSIGVFLLSVPLGTNAVEISNGIPAGTVGHFLVNVDDAGTTRRVIVTATRFASDGIDTRSVVRNYYSFVDPGNNGLGFRFRGPPPVPDPINPNRVTNNGFFFGINGNRHFVDHGQLYCARSAGHDDHLHIYRGDRSSRPFALSAASGRGCPRSLGRCLFPQGFGGRRGPEVVHF